MVERRKSYGRRAIDTKAALLEAAQEALESEAENRKKNGHIARLRRRKALPTLFALTMAFSAYALLTRPAWLQKPPPPPESPAVQEATLRLTMYTHAIRVQRFVEEHRRLPRSLAEVGVEGQGIRLEPLENNQFAIQGTSGTLELTLRSTDQMREFLGDSFEVLAGRGES